MMKLLNNIMMKRLAYDRLITSQPLDTGEEEEEEEIGLEDGQSAFKSKDFVVNSIAKILKASSVHASDIHIEPQQDRLRIRYRIDGILTEKYNLNKSTIAGITARCKVLSRLDVAEKEFHKISTPECRLTMKF